MKLSSLTPEQKQQIAEKCSKDLFDYPELLQKAAHEWATQRILSAIDEALAEVEEEQPAPTGATPDAHPQEIYLQWYGQGSPEEGERPDMENVFWCADKVFNSDIKYVRADAVSKLEQQLAQAIRERDEARNFAEHKSASYDAIESDLAALRKELDTALENQVPELHTCAGKDCKNKYCQMRQENEQLRKVAEDLAVALTKQCYLKDGLPLELDALKAITAYNLTKK